MRKVLLIKSKNASIYVSDGSVAYLCDESNQ
jgi:hypothetical protein